MLVVPSPRQTIDGSGRVTSLVISRDAELRRVPARSIGAVVAETEGMLATGVEEIWLGNRIAWTRTLGHPPEGFERAFRDLASVHGRIFRGFTGKTGRKPRRIGVYDVVSDDPPLNARRSNRRA